MSDVKYRTIVADPPWQYSSAPPTGKADRKARPESFYPTMAHWELATLPVGDMAAPNAHLYLWVTNTLLLEERSSWSPQTIAAEWGFTYKTLLTWDKTGPTGLGRYFRGRTEHVMFCVKGRLGIPAEKRESTIFHAPNGAHSAKPDAFYDLAERVSPGPYLELFARRARFGWDYWGDESLGTTQMPGEAA